MKKIDVFRSMSREEGMVYLRSLSTEEVTDICLQLADSIAEKARQFAEATQVVTERGRH